MSLAVAEDANEWLDRVKISIDPGSADESAAASNADNIVKGYLSKKYPASINTWAVPPDVDEGEIQTPAVVKEAASMLMAGFHYSKKYSEETMNPNSYATKLEERAIWVLERIADGTISLFDVELPEEVYAGLEQSNFFPNDTYTRASTRLGPKFEDDEQPNRKFGMDMIL